MSALKELLSNYRMILHEAVDSFEFPEYRRLFDLKDSAAVEFLEMLEKIDALEKLVESTEAANEQAREALKKCDPWVLKSERPILYECAVCGHEYDGRVNNISDSHEPDCAWLAALGVTND